MAFPEDEDVRRADKKFESQLIGIGIGTFLGIFLIAKLSCEPDPKDLCAIFCAQSDKKNIGQPKIGPWTLECECAKKESRDMPLIQP